jgi:hypothetical protein
VLGAEGKIIISFNSGLDVMCPGASILSFDGKDLKQVSEWARSEPQLGNKKLLQKTRRK